jgi:hypothetical protein
MKSADHRTVFIIDDDGGMRAAIKDLVQETYLKALRNFRFVSVRHQFPGVDVSNPEEHLFEFVPKTRPTYDFCDGLRGGGP